MAVYALGPKRWDQKLGPCQAGVGIHLPDLRIAVYQRREVREVGAPDGGEERGFEHRFTSLNKLVDFRVGHAVGREIKICFNINSASLGYLLSQMLRLRPSLAITQQNCNYTLCFPRITTNSYA